MSDDRPKKPHYLPAQPYLALNRAVGVVAWVASGAQDEPSPSSFGWAENTWTPIESRGV